MRRTRSGFASLFAALVLMVAASPAATMAASTPSSEPLFYTVLWQNPSAAAASLAEAGIATGDRRNYLASALPRTTVKVDAQADKFALRKLVQGGNVKRIFRNQLIKTQAFPDGVTDPNDPKYATRQWDLPMIEIQAAWAQTIGDAGVTVAVADTGLDAAHEDFVGMATVEGDAFHYDAEWLGTDDSYGHGTHVTGTIAAQTDNAIGIAGIAPDVTVMPVAVLDSSGWGTWDDVFAGVEYAADNGADLINMSLGGGGWYTDAEPYQEIVDAAYEGGTLIVAASGNDANYDYYYPSFPAGMKNVLGVGSVGESGTVSWFSNWAFADVVAPGDRTSSTIPDDYYARYSGTSMAAPHVAGVAALLLSMDNTLTPAEVSALIRASATREADDSAYLDEDLALESAGAGLLSAGDALDLLEAISGVAPTVDGLLEFEDASPLAFNADGAWTISPVVYDPKDNVEATDDCTLTLTLGEETADVDMPNCTEAELSVADVADAFGLTAAELLEWATNESTYMGGHTEIYAQLSMDFDADTTVDLTSTQTELILLADESDDGGGDGEEGEPLAMAWYSGAVTPIWDQDDELSRRVTLTSGTVSDFENAWCDVWLYRDGELATSGNAYMNSWDTTDEEGVLMIYFYVTGAKAGQNTEIKLECSTYDWETDESTWTETPTRVWVARVADATGSWTRGNRVMYRDGAHGGSFLRSVSVGGRYSFGITAKQFVLYAPKREDAPAKMKVYVDGVFQKSVTLSAGSTTYRSAFYSKLFASKAPHTVSLLNSSKYGEIDALIWR